MSVQIEQMFAGKDGWTEWVSPLPGYLMQCCDCKLIHEMEVAIVPAHENLHPTAYGEDKDHVVVFRMRRRDNVIAAENRG